MLIKKIFVTLLFLSTVCSLYAQKEQNNWFFGNNAGLTWNTTRSFTGTGMFGAANQILTGIPTVVTGSLMTTFEGCFSLSDVNGNLLFFSDGMTIWNKNKAVMSNGSGLTGDPSSAQSGVILPYPNSLTRYIALTLGNNATNNLSYSIVDMTLAGGLGAVETAYKNKLFTGQSGTLGESVTAVRNTNKKDFWVVAVGRGTTTFFNVWKITDAGGVQTARHSVASVARNTVQTTASGYIKFTQDGKHFVWHCFNERLFVYGDFDPATGILSNLKSRTGGGPATPSYGYGVEFSPNGRYLYLTYSPGAIAAAGAYNSSIEIYDLNSLLAASNPNTVNPIKIFSLGPYVANGSNDLFSGIQIGPDNRMYISNIATKSLFIIPTPDTPTTASVYKLTNVLGAGVVNFGLPSFAAPWFKMDISTNATSEVCAEYIRDYILTIQNGMGFNVITKIVVNFGDGGLNSMQTINSPILGETTLSYKYKKPGAYTITITAYNASGGVELVETSSIKILSCAIKVNKHIRGINK